MTNSLIKVRKYSHEILGLFPKGNVYSICKESYCKLTTNGKQPICKVWNSSDDFLLHLATVKNKGLAGIVFDTKTPIDPDLLKFLGFEKINDVFKTKDHEIVAYRFNPNLTRTVQIPSDDWRNCKAYVGQNSNRLRYVWN